MRSPRTSTKSSPRLPAQLEKAHAKQPSQKGREGGREGGERNCENDLPGAGQPWDASG